jgi:hypothetical protein
MFYLYLTIVLSVLVECMNCYFSIKEDFPKSVVKDEITVQDRKNPVNIVKKSGTEIFVNFNGKSMCMDWQKVYNA